MTDTAVNATEPAADTGADTDLDVDAGVDAGVDVRAEANRLARIVGARIRELRRLRGLSTAQLVARLPSGIGKQTIAAYESGTRTMPFTRFVEVMEALEAEPGVELDRCRRQDPRFVVNVDALIRSSNPLLAPLRRWAIARGASGDNAGGDMVWLTPQVIDSWAALAGCGREDMLGAFESLSKTADIPDGAVRFGEHLITVDDQRLLADIAAGAPPKWVAKRQLSELYRKLGVRDARHAIARAVLGGVPVRLPAPPAPVDRASFNEREWQAVQHLAAGNHHHRVAELLGLDEFNARVLIRKVSGTLGASSNVHLVGLALSVVQGRQPGAGTVRA